MSVWILSRGTIVGFVERKLAVAPLLAVKVLKGRTSLVGAGLECRLVAHLKDLNEL